MNSIPNINIEIVYALPDRQKVYQLQVPKNSSVEQCLQISEFLIHFPEVDLNTNQVGIYANIVPLTHICQEGDRIEIYRPITADPKKMRQIRAKKLKVSNNVT